ILASEVAIAQDSKKVSWKKVNVLVYTRNGTGYKSDNIPNAVNAIQKLSREKGFKVFVTDNPSVFTEENLKQYTFIMFPSTNNDVFDTDAQRIAFRRYIQAGGGFVGLHSVVGTERNWQWFKRMLGGTFAWHPQFQTLESEVLDKDHPAVTGQPLRRKKEDECDSKKEYYPVVKVLKAHNQSPMNANDNDAETIRDYAKYFSNHNPVT